MMKHQFLGYRFRAAILITALVICISGCNKSSGESKDSSSTIDIASSSDEINDTDAAEEIGAKRVIRESVGGIADGITKESGSISGTIVSGAGEIVIPKFSEPEYAGANFVWGLIHSIDEAQQSAMLTAIPGAPITSGLATKFNASKEMLSQVGIDDFVEVLTRNGEAFEIINHGNWKSAVKFLKVDEIIETPNGLDVICNNGRYSMSITKETKLYPDTTSGVSSVVLQDIVIDSNLFVIVDKADYNSGDAIKLTPYEIWFQGY